MKKEDILCPDFDKVVESVGAEIDIAVAGGHALLDAAKAGKNQLALCLMKNNVDLNVRDKNGNTGTSGLTSHSDRYFD